MNHSTKARLERLEATGDEGRVVVIVHGPDETPARAKARYFAAHPEARGARQIDIINTGVRRSREWLLNAGAA
jgi:hypothetical protein